MRVRSRVIALVAGAAMVAVTGWVLAPNGQAATNAALAACTAPAWAEGNTYTVGTQVSYNGRQYKALVTHTAFVGAGWNPAAPPSLWQDLGSCTPGSPPTSPTASPAATPSASPTPSPTPSTSPPPS